MASFSFGDGNAKKLLALPLYAVGRLATLFVPRARAQWVFGSASGLSDGGLALWHELDPRTERALWLVATDRQAGDAAALGIPTVRRDSLRGWWATARARVVVVTHGFGDVNRYAVSGAYIVQLWHGIPLKRIGIDSPATVQSTILPGSLFVRAVLSFMYRSATRRISLLPAASHLVRGRLESAFSLDDAHVPVTGEPRVDVLSAGTPESRRETARARLTALAGMLDDRTTLLYAPTWRDGDPDPAIPDAEAWAAIAAFLDRHDAVLYIRSHHLGVGEYTPPHALERVRMLGSDLVSDVTPLLPGFDVLVTDFSSLAFDASLVPLPVVHLAPDTAAYAERRGFYGTFDEVAGTDAAADWAGALEQLDALLSDPQVRASRLAHARWLDERVHAFRDGHNARRVYRAILAATDSDTATPVAGKETL